MRSDELTDAQVAELKRVLGPTAGYLKRMLDRMDKLAFPRDDKLYRDTRQAQHAMMDLCMTLHYLGCGHGSGSMRREHTIDQSAPAQ